MERTSRFQAGAERSGWRAWGYRLAMAPRGVLLGLGLAILGVALALIVTGALLYRPETVAATQVDGLVLAAPMPPDFTPVASPPPSFGQPPPAPAQAGSVVQLPLLVVGGGAATPPAAAPTLLPSPTATPVAVDAELWQGAQGSQLTSQGLITILLLGTDARPDQTGPSRSDTLMLLVVDTINGSVTAISVPRDVWVNIPGFGEGRVNTAYFLGEGWSDGPEVARQTVSQLLGIPITHTVVVNFDGFRALIDDIGGVDIDVPTPIDDLAFPDDSYGTMHLVIPAGPQHMDGTQALRYARTRHGSSDLERAARQQAVLEAARRQLLRPENLASLPRFIGRALSEVETTLALPDLFFLARFARTLDEERLHMHVLLPPLLWNGVTADGQQVLLYDPYAVRQSVQQWLAEAAAP